MDRRTARATLLAALVAVVLAAAPAAVPGAAAARADAGLAASEGAAFPSLGGARRWADRQARNAVKEMRKDKKLMKYGRKIGLVRKPRTKFGLVSAGDDLVEARVDRLAEVAFFASLVVYEPNKGMVNNPIQVPGQPRTRHFAGCRGFTIRSSTRVARANAHFATYNGQSLRVMAFTGSDDAQDWKSDVDSVPVPFVVDIPRGQRQLGGVQRGTLAEWNRLKANVMQLAAGWNSNPPNEILLTGHSLGGALAHLAAASIAARYPDLADRLVVISYGSPRLGNRAWFDAYAGLVRSSARIEIHRDPVPDIAGHLLTGGRLFYTYRCPEGNSFTSAPLCHQMHNYGKVVAKKFGPKDGNVCRA